jgi:CBS domain-containing protein
MRTGDLCRRQVVTATLATSLSDLSQMMRTQHVGSVVVLAEGGGRKPAGIVTDRDIVIEVVAMGLNPAVVTAGDVMTPSPVVAKQEDDALWALKVMRDRGVRRLPVVDEQGALTGLLSFDDLMQHFGTTLGDIAQVIGTERVVESARRS